MSEQCVQCGGKKGPVVEGRRRCEACLEYNRAMMKQYQQRKREGRVGAVGRPPIAASTTTPQALLAPELTAYLPNFHVRPHMIPINYRIFTAGCVELEKYMPSRNAEALLCTVLNTLFEAARSDTIQKVASDSPTEAEAT
jgi:hypothetical protein